MKDITQMCISGGKGKVSVEMETLWGEREVKREQWEKKEEEKRWEQTWFNERRKAVRWGGQGRQKEELMKDRDPVRGPVMDSGILLFVDFVQNIRLCLCNEATVCSSDSEDQDQHRI